MLSGKGLGATGAGVSQSHGCQPGCVTGWQHGWTVNPGCRCVTWSRVRAGRLVVVRFVEWLEEWVSHSFGGQVCAWAVAWDDLDRGCRVVQRKELGQDAVDEEIIVAAGVVGAADGTGEERVAAEEDALGALEEAQAAA